MKSPRAAGSAIADQAAPVRSPSPPHRLASSTSSLPSLPSPSSSSSTTPAITSHWMYFFKEFPRVIFKFEANQRYMRVSAGKRIEAGFPINRPFDVPIQRLGNSSISSKYMFIAEWRHLGQQSATLRGNATLSSADASGDCVALKAPNGMYLSVEQKDGSLTLVYAYSRSVFL